MKFPFAQPQPDGTVWYHCLPCNTYYPPTDFYSSSVARSYHRCRHCVLKSQHQRPHTGTHRWIRRLRRLAGQRIYVEPADLERVPTDQSIISGAQDHLVVTRFFPQQPIALDNLVCLTSQEARALEAAGDPALVFPPDVVERVQGVLSGEAMEM